MSESISFDEYEIEIDPEQPSILQITNSKTQHTMRLTAEEAVNMLKLMYKRRDDLRALRTGKL
jgi:hypothetical protein